MKSLRLKSFVPGWLSLLMLTLLAACGGSSSNDPLPKVFTSTLVGSEETPPNNSAGKGIGLLVFHPGDRTFTATVVSTGVADTEAHIHEGAPGVPGPVIFPLTKEPGKVQWQAKGTLTPDQEAKLRAGGYYFNVHSPTFPNGEIRGQVTEKTLSPDQERQLQQALQQTGTQLQQVSTALQGAQALQQQGTQAQQLTQQAQQAAQAAQQQAQRLSAQAQQAAQSAQPQGQGAGGAGGAGGGTPGMTGMGTTAP